MMELRIFDYDSYEKDVVAQRVQEKLNPLCENIDGMWLYREPEMRTEGNELPTFTIVSPSVGLCFIKAFRNIKTAIVGNAHKNRLCGGFYNFFISRANVKHFLNLLLTFDKIYDTLFFVQIQVFLK